MSTHRPRLAPRVVDAIIAAVALVLDLSIYLGTHENPIGVVPIVLIVCSSAALLVRRRWPFPAFGVVWLVALSTIVFGDVQTFIAPMVMILTLAELLSLQMSLAGLVVMYIAFVVRGLVFRHDAISLAFGFGFYGVFSIAAWAGGNFRRRSKDHVLALREQHQRESDEAIRAERLRLGRELHDIVSHTVNVMTLQAAGAKAVMQSSPERVTASLDVIEHAGVQAMNELHRLLYVLRTSDPSEEPLTAQPRLSDLPELIEVARKSGQDIRLDLAGNAGELDPSVELAVFRVVQEALTNARKYAGQDAQVRVNLEWLPPQLVVTVANDSGGDRHNDQLAALSTGHGLLGLAERIQLVGGELETTATPEGGYRVRAVLPVAAVRQPDPPTADTVTGASPQAWGSFD